MGKFILYLVMTASNGNNTVGLAINTQEFSDQNSCVLAQNRMVYEAQRMSSGYGVNLVVAACVAKEKP